MHQGVHELKSWNIRGVTFTLYEAPDGHDYVLGTSSLLAISNIHAEGCRKCDSSRVNRTPSVPLRVDKGQSNGAITEEWGVGGA